MIDRIQIKPTISNSVKHVIIWEDGNSKSFILNKEIANLILGLVIELSALKQKLHGIKLKIDIHKEYGEIENDFPDLDSSCGE